MCPSCTTYYAKLVTALFSMYTHQTLYYTWEGTTVYAHQISSTKAHFSCISSSLNQGEMLPVWSGISHTHSSPNSVLTHSVELTAHGQPFTLLPPKQARNQHCKHKPPNRLHFQTEPEWVIPMHPTTPSSLLHSFLCTHTKLCTTLWKGLLPRHTKSRAQRPISIAYTVA